MHAQIAKDRTERQLVDYSIEPKWPDTLRRRADDHKSHRPHTMDPNVRKQDVVTNDSDHDIRYLGTTATDHSVPRFPRCFTSGSITFDDETSLKNTHVDFFHSFVYSCCIPFTKTNYVSNEPRNILEKPRTDSMDHESVRMQAFVDMTRNNVPQHPHNMMTESNDTVDIRTNGSLGNAQNTRKVMSPHVEVYM